MSPVLPQRADRHAMPRRPASITRARIWRKKLEFVGLPVPLLPVGRWHFFDRNIWPDFRVFRIQRQPFLKPWFGISLDGIDGTFRFANATVDAFVRMDDEHILALVEAVHGAHSDAVHGFAANATLVHDIGHLGLLPADRGGHLAQSIYSEVKAGGGGIDRVDDDRRPGVLSRRDRVPE